MIDELCRAADELQLPRSFANDLHKHDRAALAKPENTGRPFAWLLYNEGTHLVWQDDDGRWPSVLNMIHETFCDRRSTPWQWFYSDGGTLTPVTIEQLA